ncbi:MAG TPA: hypothetical protein VF463_18845 [Sphingobium sp.]
MPASTENELRSILDVLPKAVARLPSPVRYRAENALDGFIRARALLPIDREMASFRAITAGEEAASALIRSLQLRDYPGSDLIDLKKHPHKVAVLFFLDAVRHELAGKGTVDLSVTLGADPPKLTVSLPIRQFVDLPDDLANIHIELAEPLGLIGTKPGVEEENFFDKAVQKVAGSRKVDKLIASQANSRNHILYAHDNGFPISQVTERAIDLRENGAVLCLIIAIAILQVNHHQSFALQCLKGYLKVIKRSKAT